MRLSQLLASGIGPAVVAFMLGAVPPGALGAAGGSPKAVIPVLTRDVGKVVFGGKVSAEFTVMNKGDAVLNILSAKPG